MKTSALIKKNSHFLGMQKKKNLIFKKWTGPYTDPFFSSNFDRYSEKFLSTRSAVQHVVVRRG